MPKRIPSYENQIVHVLTHLCRIGQSRHAAKRRPGLTPGTCEADWHIYSEDTRDRYTEAWLALLHILGPVDRLKLLRDVTPEIFLKGLQVLKDKGNSDATLKTQLCAWRKLARGRILAGWSDVPAEVLVPDTLYTDLEGSRPQGPINERQAALWRTLVVEAAARSRTYGADLVRMFDLLLHAGLRLDECARLREGMFDRAGYTLALPSSITKGGRPRSVTLETPEARAALDSIPIADDWLWLHGPKLARRLRATMYAAAQEVGIAGRKGPHGLRALCAQRALDRQRAAIDAQLLPPDGVDPETLREYSARRKIAERAARQAVSRMLGHKPSFDRVACALLRFADVPVARWMMALRPEQDPTVLPLGHFYGHGVDSGTSCFVDAMAVAALSTDDLKSLFRDRVIGAFERDGGQAVGECAAA